MQNTDVEQQPAVWPLWRKVIFRFFFIFLALQMAPWTWLDDIPGVTFVTKYYETLNDWAVDKGNAHLFHVRPVLVPVNGSGDTSYGWAQVWLFLSLALLGCLVWSFTDRRRKNYTRLNYWLCLFARYYLILFAFNYGLIKLFAMQMYFPSLHQLATPLGDLLPMRFSWLFIGYSKPYQVFSGIMETVAGLMLLNRRTATLGVLIATGVFLNVTMLNLSYDIPVKIFSMELTLVSLFLLAQEAGRLWNFFVLNKAVAADTAYRFPYPKKWMRIGRVVLKLAFVILFIGLPIFKDYAYYEDNNKIAAKQPIRNGVYEVTVFKVNNRVVPPSLSDSLRWQDVIFEDGTGSAKTTDTSFRQRYRRAYFTYTCDPKTNTLHLKKMATDSLPFMNLTYQLPDKNTIRLQGLHNKDSLFVELKLLNRHFQLAEKQFHWLSEHNR